MRSRDSFGEVLEDLRGRIRRGDLAPGAPLIVMDLAADLRVSATPVREALAYLAGAGLVDGRLGVQRGYSVGRPGPEDLADLLRLHQAQVMIGLADAGRSAGMSPRLEPDGPEAPMTIDLRIAETEAVFAGWVGQGGGGALRRAHRLLADRLQLVRRREDRLFAGLDLELAELKAVSVGPASAAVVRAYHRRRLAQVVRLAGLL